MNNLLYFILGAFVGGNIVAIAVSALAMSERQENKKNTSFERE